MQNNFVFN